MELRPVSQTDKIKMLLALVAIKVRLRVRQWTR